MPPATSSRMCPCCKRLLAEGETLEKVEGTKRTMQPTANPPKFTVFACSGCVNAFRNMLLLLQPHFPQAIIWPESDPRRPR